MKKIYSFLVGLVLATGTSFAQTNKEMRIGLMTGGYGNPSKFSGGMSDAPSEFSHDPYGTGSFDITFRYEHSRRWAFMSGIGFTSAGFNFTLANDYSLEDECKDRYDMLESSIPAAQVPVMVLLKTNNNCRNWRWIFGAGIVNSFVSETEYNYTEIFSQEQEQNAEFMSIGTRSEGGYYLQSRFLVGREKQFARGALLSFMLVCNHGYSDIAEAMVNYNQDNKVYYHEFTNQGSYCGFSIAYSFRPIGSKTVTKKSADPLPIKIM
jgi:hypothetical protein